MEKRMLKHIGILACMLLACAACALGATINAQSCSQSHVQAAVNSAASADTVLIPSGTCTWSSPVTISKGITLQGRGEDMTVIIADTDVALRVNADSSHVRISGIGFGGTASWAFITLEGSYLSFRCDHLKFASIPGSRGIFVNYNRKPGVRGVFDHLTVHTDSSKIFIAHYGDNNNWNRPESYGTEDFVFIEDSTFISSVQGGDIIDGECGARFVVRHNSITNFHIHYHDTGSTPGCRSTRAVEIYGNTFKCQSGNCGYGAISFRGGTGLYYDNVIDIYSSTHPGFEFAATPQIYRVVYTGGIPWNSRCDGTVDRVCSDFLSHCATGNREPCTGDWSCPNSDCRIHQCSSDSECGPGRTCLQLDGHMDSSGWPCRDQTGRGMDDPITHVQASSPAYWWNNKDHTGKIIYPRLPERYGDYLKENRDYCYQDPGTACGTKGAWTYSSYAYPHPLQTGTAQSCGNDIAEGTESCDGTDLAGQTCISRGFGGGTLACDSQCTGFVTAGCTAAQCPFCCPQGYVCTQPASGTGCSGTCCASQAACTAGLQPGFIIEAESGSLSGMQTAASGADTYIYTSTDNTGSASYAFTIAQSGKYLLEARADNKNSGGENSFFVGLDSEPANGNVYYTYNVFPLQAGFFWDNVSRWGNGQSGTPPISEFDPMVWELSQGTHTFTFYGREANTWLDKIILKRCITHNDLVQRIGQWKEGSINLAALMEAIGKWKSGC